MLLGKNIHNVIHPETLKNNTFPCHSLTLGINDVENFPASKKLQIPSFMGKIVTVSFV